MGFLFLCLISLNPLLKQHIPTSALNSAELMTVLSMSLVIIGIPVFLTGYSLAIPTTPYYFASAENQWGEFVIPHLPAWLLPSNDGPAPWAILFDGWAMPLF